MDKRVKSLVYLVLLAAFVSCNQGKKQTTEYPAPDPDREPVSATLFDKSLPEIKELINGRWQLISGQSATLFFEFDDTFIEFKGDQYVWSDEDGVESGKLNWRQAPSGNGYDAFFMDVFYEENPTFPLAIRQDTLMIQDISSNLYLYRLVRR